jgi:hypothetical protein
MIEADPEYYQALQKELNNYNRQFILAWIGFIICIGIAFQAGIEGGWFWLLGSLVSLIFVLWLRIDMQSTRILIQIYLASAKSRYDS